MVRMSIAITIGHRVALGFRLTMLCPSVCSDWSRVPQSLDQTAPSMAMTAMKAPDGPHVHHQERSPQLPEPPAEGANEDQVRSGHRHSPAGQVRSSQQGQPQTHFQEHPSMTGRPTDNGKNTSYIPSSDLSVRHSDSPSPVSWLHFSFIRSTPDSTSCRPTPAPSVRSQLYSYRPLVRSSALHLITLP